MLFGCLEAGGTKMVCAICDETGCVVERDSIPTETPPKTIPTLISFFQKYPIKALGIGCFGPIDLDEHSPSYGTITSTPKIDWQNYPILETFQTALNIPVGIDTDVNASALGEAVFGCTRDVQNSIYITIGTGIGVGVIIGGKPYHGMMHPEGGHILLSRHPDDPLERGVCPFHCNCFEGLSSGPSLSRRWGKPGAELADEPNVWELEAFYIGQALYNYIMLLSPERIVLGGGVLHQQQLLPLIRHQVFRQLGDYIQVPCFENLDSYIVGCSLNDNQGILGCLKLAMNAEGEHADV